jgi:dTDP-4-amino-4,6-dideoxygalactose transaminase
MFKIPFFKKPVLNNELLNLQQFYQGYSFKEKCTAYFQKQYNNPYFYFAKSCTQSLEVALMSLRLPEGKEVILPSYAYVSLANAVMLNGLKCIFVDIEPRTMNVSPQAIEDAITSDTGAILTLNYSGVACDYGQIRSICEKYSLPIIEDNAHGINCKKNGRLLGTFGDISTISFDMLKNVGCFEGGGIMFNQSSLLELYHSVGLMGTNRAEFFKGDVSHYEWVSMGTNTSLAAPLYAILFAQLEHSEELCAIQRSKWNYYYHLLSALGEKGYIQLPGLSADDDHNGHIFWIKVRDEEERSGLVAFLNARSIQATFHYYPLHNSIMGKKVGEFRGKDEYTTRDSSRLLRLPIYHDLSQEDIEYVVASVFDFYKK